MAAPGEDIFWGLVELAPPGGGVSATRILLL
jgi:hypothetical protein